MASKRTCHNDTTKLLVSKVQRLLMLTASVEICSANSVAPIVFSLLDKERTQMAALYDAQLFIILFYFVFFLFPCRCCSTNMEKGPNESSHAYPKTEAVVCIHLDAKSRFIVIFQTVLVTEKIGPIPCERWFSSMLSLTKCNRTPKFIVRSDTLRLVELPS